MNTEADRLFAQASQLQRQGARAAAIDAFRRGLELRPADAERWYEFGYLLKADGRYDDALAAYGEALARGVSRAEEVHVNRGVIYSDHLRRDDDAARELDAAIALNPDYLPALLNLGNLHEEQGRRDEALAIYARAIAVGEAGRGGRDAELQYEALARSARLAPPAGVDDPVIARLQAAAAAPTSILVRANVLFALGQTFEKLGAHDAAFDAFARANRWLVREHGRRYDRPRMEATMAAMREAFATPAQADAAPTSPEPLFVLGMWRSGSTLIEQVLGSHPQVTAGGELDFLPRLAVERLAPFPQSMASPDPVRDAELAKDYRAHLLRLFPDAAGDRYITDKRPDNFMLVGLIKRMFPRARIVHTIRHPVDNGLSVFMQHLHLQVAGYSADLADIGHYYGQYRALMAHWKALYPEDILDFEYDAFVADPRPHLARLLEFLGLPWDERCLSFHELGNTVKTASYWQVRQPLNTSASGRWKRYERHLAPLVRELRAAGIEVDDTVRDRDV
ncbi:sulfotransferase family protein [Lysobacter humi (ex Lee et al. 2017)]